MKDSPINEPSSEEAGIQSRRSFLQGAGKWSGAAIIAAVAGTWLGSTPQAQAGAWINRRCGGGGGWINGRGGGGGSWINGRGGYGGGSWINRRY